MVAVVVVVVVMVVVVVVTASPPLAALLARLTPSVVRVGVLSLGTLGGSWLDLPLIRVAVAVRKDLERLLRRVDELLHKHQLVAEIPKA